MSRSVKKGHILTENYLKGIKTKETGRTEPIRTWARSCTVVPEFVAHTFMIHNGKIFHRLFVTDDMVGHKLGEFSLTRTFRAHGGVKKKETPHG